MSEGYASRSRVHPDTWVIEAILKREGKCTKSIVVWDFSHEKLEDAETILCIPELARAEDAIEHMSDILISAPMAPRAEARKFCFILPLGFLEGERRFSRIFEFFPPTRIWVFSGRPTFHDETGKSVSVGPMAWYVWDFSRPLLTRTPSLHWIPADEKPKRTFRKGRK